MAKEWRQSREILDLMPLRLVKEFEAQLEADERLDAGRSRWTHLTFQSSASSSIDRLSDPSATSAGVGERVILGPFPWDEQRSGTRIKRARGRKFELVEL